MNARGNWFIRDRGIQPPADHPQYKSTVLRAPKKSLLSLQQTLSEKTGPVFGHSDLDPLDDDMIRNAVVDREPIGERTIVHGYVLDQNGRPVPHTLLEVWQANAGGRYRHVNDNTIAEIDPNFSGFGRCMTDENGYYSFRTIRPGPYPWRNSPNEWRPAHIHYSLFGEAFTTRLITQMYFEGDPLIPFCPIVSSIPDEGARQRLVAKLDLEETIPMDALAYRFDIVLRGRRSTPFENRMEGN